ncbi:MAG: malectin domain-containing carbohydrate-binding protein [Spirochaetota bacterium]|nr:malectin domain-containing carbohydrate-binding protein [Spirochaetota bacterium]
MMSRLNVYSRIQRVEWKGVCLFIALFLFLLLINCSELPNQELPNAPFDLEAEAVSSNQVDLHWQAVSDNTVGFKIERRLLGGDDYLEIAEVSTDERSYSDNEVAQNNTYTYRARAYNNAGLSAYSNEASATTPVSETSVMLINCGSNEPYVDTLGRTWSVDYGWTGYDFSVDRGSIEIDNTEDDRIYQLERYSLDGYSLPILNDTYTVKLHFAETYIGIGDAGERVMDIDVEGHLLNDLDVFAEVGGRNVALVKIFNDVVVDDGLLDISIAASINEPMINGIEVVSLSPPTIAPEAPDNLIVTVDSCYQLSLSWNDNSDNEYGFKIERAEDDDGIPGIYEQIAIALSNETTCDDIRVSTDTTYYYRVRSYNNVGASDYSNEASATTCPQEPSGDTIADHLVAKESVLRRIPESAINAAKDNLHIMYCGTSHSSQVKSGMEGLLDYQDGDDVLFAVTFDGNPVQGELDIDYRPTTPVDVYSAYDLSHDSVDGEGHTNYYHRTIDYLDHPEHADVNVVMWSWCSIEGHDVQIYIDNFAELIDMYRAGGSKGRTSENAVTFVFMTGYARGSWGDTPEPPYIETPYQNHKRIVDYCEENGYFCLDYWSHDTHNYETDEFYPTAQGNSPTHLLEWMNDHPDDWYYCCPAHACDYHLLGNRRAYAAWWIWARLAGWDGQLEE